jgi:hypothetical protein
MKILVNLREREDCSIHSKVLSDNAPKLEDQSEALFDKTEELLWNCDKNFSTSISI